MKQRIVTVACVILSLCCVAGVYAAESSPESKGRMYARRGSDDGGHHDDHRQYHDSRGRGRGHRDFRYYRYYPDYYFHRRHIYYSPFRRNYYFYDVLPDKVYYYEIERDRPSQNPNYLPIMTIANMGAQGIPDDVIIEEIRRTHSTYVLSSEIIEYLRQNNVGDKVIDYMIETGRK